MYRLNVDNDGDAQADAAFSIVFSEPNGDTQTGTVYYATGSQARDPEPAGKVLFEAAPVGFDAMAAPVEAGPCRLFIGVRSDPLFADGEGAFHDFQFTGDDTFAGKNILEVPDDMLGPDPEIGAWATCSVRRDGTLVQVDRCRKPSFNPFFVDELKNMFNAGHPPRRRGELLGALDEAPGESRLCARGGQGHRSDRAPRRPALRPQSAGALPQRPGSDR